MTLSKKRYQKKSKRATKRKSKKKLFKGGEYDPDEFNDIFYFIEEGDYFHVKEMLETDQFFLKKRNEEKDTILHDVVKEVRNFSRDIYDIKGKLEQHEYYRDLSNAEVARLEESLNTLISNQDVIRARKKRILDLILEIDYNNTLLNERNNLGETPIFTAVREYNVDALIKLLRKGANVLVENNKGLRASDCTEDDYIKEFLQNQEKKQIIKINNNLATELNGDVAGVIMRKVNGATKIINTVQ